VLHIREPKSVLPVNHSQDTLEIYRIDLAMAGFRGPQAARLFGLREQTCRIVLDDLTTAGLLRRSSAGHAASGAAR
jgi:hypothetical protein